MKLNVDVGEGNEMADQAVMPWVDMANVACGFHASDAEGMASTVELALKHGVMVGAHPSYQDREGFGRFSIKHTPSEILHLVLYQAGALDAICKAKGAELEYIKPHGALYHDMMQSEDVYGAILKAAAIMQVPLMVMAQPDAEASARYDELADEHGVSLIREAFADRAYTKQGGLVARSEAHAVHRTEQELVKQAEEIIHQGMVTSECGEMIALKADSLCIHGDHEVSVRAVQKFHKVLHP